MAAAPTIDSGTKRAGVVVLVAVAVAVVVPPSGPSGDDMPTATTALCRCFGYLHMAMAVAPPKASIQPFDSLPSLFLFPTES